MQFSPQGVAVKILLPDFRRILGIPNHERAFPFRQIARNIPPARTPRPIRRASPRPAGISSKRATARRKPAILDCVALSGLDAYVESPQFGTRPRVRNSVRLRQTACAVVPDVRNPAVKNYHWLDFVRGLYQAYDRGAETAILPDIKCS